MTERLELNCPVDVVRQVDKVWSWVRRTYATTLKELTIPEADEDGGDAWERKKGLRELGARLGGGARPLYCVRAFRESWMWASGTFVSMSKHYAERGKTVKLDDDAARFLRFLLRERLEHGLHELKPVKPKTAERMREMVSTLEVYLACVKAHERGAVDGLSELVDG